MCPHNLQPLYDSSTVPASQKDLARMDIVLKGLADYYRCSLCGRIACRGPSRLNWLDMSTQERREKDLREWYAHFERRESQRPS